VYEDMIDPSPDYRKMRSYVGLLMKRMEPVPEGSSFK
jgi:hypothetical protein